MQTILVCRKRCARFDREKSCSSCKWEQTHECRLNPPIVLYVVSYENRDGEKCKYPEFGYPAVGDSDWCSNWMRKV
jgi:hypothetical protein